jgi:hypothetical protein
MIAFAQEMNTAAMVPSGEEAPQRWLVTPRIGL